MLSQAASWFYDFFVGIELNPRVGQALDLKFWSIGRPSMIAWTIVNWSFAAQQYKIHGYVSNSMIMVNLIALVYCVDFFINEDWYGPFPVAEDEEKRESTDANHKGISARSILGMTTSASTLLGARRLCCQISTHCRRSILHATP